MDGESHDDRARRLDNLWKTLDTRDEGQLDLAGLKKGLKKIDHPLKNADDLLKDVLKTVDTSGDGHIQYNEFRVFVEHTERELWHLFESIDRDNSGSLDKGELQHAFAKAGISISNAKLNQFFNEVDTNNDGVISFEEWRDFLLFIPGHTPNLRAILSYYDTAVTVNSEGDVHINDVLNGLGYFVAGGIAGAVSRTATAPLDRLKVYLIAQTSAKEGAVYLAKQGSPLRAMTRFASPLVQATKELWRVGGMRSLFAGNGLNVVKVMPESAIKFGAYEACKKIAAQVEGHGDSKHIGPWSQFLAGGAGGMIAQCFVYPLDTLKFRMQCETVAGGLHGNKLISATARTMWRTGGIPSFYHGLPMGLAGMFPYSAIDLATFEALKRWTLSRRARIHRCHEDDVRMSNFETGVIGAFSGAISATAVYPMNLLRTRLQAQGTVLHPPTYTGIWDVTLKTLKAEGFSGLFKGVTPNLLKVAPAVSISYLTYENSKALMGLE